MKKIFVRDLDHVPEGTAVTLLGWLKAKRNLGGLLFVDLCDSTGSIQIVVKRDQADSSGPPDQMEQPVATATATQVAGAPYRLLKAASQESAIKADGVVQLGQSGKEVHVTAVEVVGQAELDLSPRPRSDFDVFDVSRADHLLRSRHFYLRNEKVMAVLKFRHLLMRAIHNWFNQHQYVEITAPVLTPLPLYDDKTALQLDVHDDSVFLTQCVGFYLESAVHAFERVYNIGPSFRGEESRSKRHLMEYWHIKAELAWVNLEDLIRIVEDLISHTVSVVEPQSDEIMSALGTQLCMHGLDTPYPRITYAEAVERLHHLGMEFEFGQSMGSKEEEALSKQFVSPFWIVGIPRAVEPFPYVVDQKDTRVTMTADLIATGGYGELLGVAEKIHDLSELDERMQEKGKFGDERYDWLRDLRKNGCVPHGGFGMGFERFIRWLLDIPHVRDTIPFPRTFRRRIFP
ncbi:hypothetical protein H6770_00105 [Candidatus Peribacteria bacterium]|nr:hypothetical protein [Candidatus Peribacteria bacterium]